MKTIRQWFNTMPEPYRREAFENTPTEHLEYNAQTIGGALAIFKWRDTPQGFGYWFEVHQLMRSYNNTWLDLEDNGVEVN